MAGPWEKYKKQEEGPWTRFPSKPEPQAEPSLFWSDITTDDEFKAIADKHGVNVDTLKKAAPFFGASKEDEGPQDLAKQVAGFAGQASAVGVPQKLYKMSKSKEEEAALDELDMLARKKKSYLRDAAEIFGGFGMAGLTAKLGKAALPIFGAAAGLGSSEAGDELKSAAVGAVAAPVLGKAVEKVASGAGKIASKLRAPAQTTNLTKTTEGIEDLVQKKMAAGEANILKAEQEVLKSGKADDLINFLGEDRTVSLLKPTSTEYRLIVSELKERGVPVNNRNIAQEVANNKLESLREDVARRVGAESWEKAVKEHGGIDRLVNEVLPQIKTESIARQIILDENLGKNLRKIGPVEGLMLKLADDKPVMKIVDKRLGGTGKLSAELAVDDLSGNIAKYSPLIKQETSKLLEFDNLLKKKGIGRDEFDTMYRTGNLPQSIKQAWDSFTSSALNQANRLGAGIEARADYIQDAILPPAELQNVLRNNVKLLNKKYGMDVSDVTPDQWKIISNQKDIKELVRAVDLVSGKTSDTSQQFVNNFNNIIQGVGEQSSRLYSQMGSAKEKIGDIPGFIRETDPIRGMESWIAMTYKNLATREPVERLRSIANIADEAGDVWTARHLRDKVQDILGVRKDTLAGGSRELATKWKSYWLGKDQQVLSDIPEYIGATTRQMYPNLLGGANIKVALQNLATPLLGAVPDVGIKAGTKAWWNALGSVRSQMGKLGREGFENFLAKEGMIPANIGKEVGALKSTSGKLGKLNQASNDALMFGFNLSEIIARGQAYFMGQELGKQVAANPEWGRQFVSKLNSPAYRRTISDALSRGDVQGVQNQLSKYLNSNHLLNYDKANQSAFGRFVGPTFAAFQKWPSTMLGKVLQEMYDKGGLAGSAEVAKKIMAPVVALGIADELIRGDDVSPRSQKILGRDLADMAPGVALKDAATFKPPALGIAGQVGEGVSGLLEGDENKILKAAKKTLMTYAPGAGWVKMFGEDLPLLISGEKKK